VFTDLQPTFLQSIKPPFRRHRTVASSVVAHLALLIVIVFYTGPVIDIHPDWLAHGDSDHTYRLTYIPPDDLTPDTPPDAARLIYPKQPAKPRVSPKLKVRKPPEQIVVDADAADHNSQAGSPLGTVLDGPITGHEVHVAYSVVHPDPPVDRAALPRDLVGDVVIEVTIDSQGNVVETKIMQAIGHGIDEKIESTVRRWHFQPATLDGTPVASRVDVHYHFPS